MNGKKYYVEDDWTGPYDNAPTCIYTRCVGCYDQSGCETCGWNPIVSMLRIKNKFGEKYIRSLGCARK